MGSCDSKANYKQKKEEEHKYDQLKYTQGTIKQKADDRLRITSCVSITDETMEVHQTSQPYNQ